MSSKSKSSSETKRVTIYDVAREAGVAPSTVSRTFSRPGRVNAETAARVRKVAEKIGYRAATNSFTSAQSTQLIAVAVPDIANPSCIEIIKGIRHEALAAGYSTILLDATEIDDQNSETLEQSMGLAEGLILVSPHLSQETIQAMAKQRPIVTVNYEVPGVPAVINDAHQGISEMVTHLYNLGHRSITFLPEPNRSYDDAQRWQALLEQCSRKKMTIRHTHPLRPTVAGGAAAAREWMQRRTSAVIAHNDLMAMGFMIAVKSVGIEVPRDVSVVGTDNIFMSALFTPALTTVTTSRNTQGKLAFNQLLEQLRHQHRDTGHLTTSIAMKLVERDSTAQVPSLHR
ncbi:LacI family DNA-binding transcriptional regulator [Lawsonella clevelandensis]|uniref:LacI family transcriptional regulator n=1 Tax=Lawsonella clevelandensis TaxID=1528099 RepID=A0A2W5K240_9ACTN|nr:LacI family DNA-binding transcriptional regulator [Lawsonella clevelandensis]PZP88846.1 MAG: LacI family transcriptional regulator [Lawsonella clevelandensis]